MTFWYIETFVKKIPENKENNEEFSTSNMLIDYLKTQYLVSFLSLILFYSWSDSISRLLGRKIIFGNWVGKWREDICRRFGSATIYIYRYNLSLYDFVFVFLVIVIVVVVFPDPFSSFTFFFSLWSTNTHRLNIFMQLNISEHNKYPVQFSSPKIEPWSNQ